MKKCCKCKEIKELTEFFKSKDRKDGVQTYCKACGTKRRSQYYQDNKKTELATRRRHFLFKRNWLTNFKKTCKCNKCGDSRWYVLDFHHKDREAKEFTLGRFKEFAIEKLIEEISKCEVLCSNCHREFHHLENNGCIV